MNFESRRCEASNASNNEAAEVGWMLWSSLNICLSWIYDLSNFIWWITVELVQYDSEQFLGLWLSLEWHEIEILQTSSQLKSSFTTLVTRHQISKSISPIPLKYFRLGFRAWVRVRVRVRCVCVYIWLVVVQGPTTIVQHKPGCAIGWP